MTDDSQFDSVGEWEPMYYQAGPFKLFSSQEFNKIVEFYDESFIDLMYYLDETSGIVLKEKAREYLIDTQYKFYQSDNGKQNAFYPLHKKFQLALYLIIDTGGKLNAETKRITAFKFRELFYDYHTYLKIIELLIKYNYITRNNNNNSFNWVNISKKQGEVIIDMLNSLLKHDLIKREYFKPEIISNIFKIDFNLKLSSKTYRREILEVNDKKSKFGFFYI